MRPKENLLAWKIFLKTSQTLSIVQTSIQMNMDLATTSRILANLEKDLEVNLFDRSKRPLRLTSTGLKALQPAKAMLKAHEKLCSVVNLVTSVKRNVKMSLPVNMTREDLFGILDEYKKIDPDLQIEIHNDCDHRHLEEGEIELAMLPYIPQSEKIAWFDAGYSYNMFLCSPGYLEAHGEPKSIEDLKKHKLLLRRSRIYPHTKFVTHKDQIVPLSEEYATEEIGDAFSCKQAALLGVGISIDLSVAYCKPEIDAGELVVVLPGWHRPRWDMTVALRKEDLDDQQLTQFAKWFAAKQKAAYPDRWGPLFKKFNVSP